MKYATDLWQVGIVKQPIASLVGESGAWPPHEVLWLPNPGSFRFLADPFGVWRGDLFTVYVEAFDYRNKRGEIHYYQYDAAWQLQDQGVALTKPYHLSYPYLIEDEGTLYMLPEAHHSGTLTLYRCKEFPAQWEEVGVMLDLPAIDASVIKYGARWWMFYSLPGENQRAMRELHLAYADQLTGRWTPHPANPVRTGLSSSRPGGTPFVEAGQLYLPTQDCTQHYGQAIQILRITHLSPEDFSCESFRRLTPEGLPTDYTEGLHTCSGAGNITLVDVKKIDLSPLRGAINWQRRLRRVLGQR